MTCKTCFLQYKWNYANSICICVKSMFISPLLDYNWMSDLVVSDRQHIPTMGHTSSSPDVPVGSPSPCAPQSGEVSPEASVSSMVGVAGSITGDSSTTGAISSAPARPCWALGASGSPLRCPSLATDGCSSLVDSTLGQGNRSIKQ